MTFVPVDILDAVSKSDTVFSDKFGRLAVEADGLRVVIGANGFWRTLFDGRITSMLPPCGRCMTVVDKLFSPTKKKTQKQQKLALFFYKYEKLVKLLALTWN